MSTDISTEGFIPGGGGAGGTVTVTYISPSVETVPGGAGGFPADYTSAKSTPIVLSVTDNEGAADLIYLAITLVMPDGTSETVFRDGQFMGKYSNTSEQEAISGGVQLTITRSGGWPSNSQFISKLRIYVDVVNKEGTITALNDYYELPSPNPTPTPVPPPTIPGVAAGAVDQIATAANMLVSQLRTAGS